MEATVTIATPGYSPTSSVRHSTEVCDVHEDVKHATVPSVTVRLMSEYSPKLNPPTVNEVPPLSGILVAMSWYFGSAADATGASKLNKFKAVPTTAATVGCSACGLSTKPLLKQRIQVCVVHVAVKHGAAPRASVGVGSMPPKDSPRTVTDLCPDAGELKYA
jgi:hypothetical protein